MKSISVIIPAYNEEQRIIPNVLAVGRALWGLGYNIQAIVVDDGSTDNTLGYLCRYFEGIKGFTIIHQKKNYGKGAAIRAGIEQATGDYIAFIDADLDIVPTQFSLLLDLIDCHNADVVIGSKMHHCSVVHYPWGRRICSLGYYYFIKLLFGLRCHDTQTGIKLFKAEALRSVDFDTNGFTFDLELLVKLYRKGYKIEEAPVILETQRKYYEEKARIGPRIIWRMFRDTIKLWIKLRG